MLTVCEYIKGRGSKQVSKVNNRIKSTDNQFCINIQQNVFILGLNSFRLQARYPVASRLTYNRRPAG